VDSLPIFLQITIAVLAAVCIFGIFWAAFGTMRTPVRCGKGCALSTIVSVRGSAPELEQTLKGLIWLQENGALTGQILIADCGMDEEGQALVRLAVKKYEKIAFCRAEDVTQWIVETP